MRGEYMKRWAKIITLIFVCSVILLVVVYSQYDFVLARVDDPFKDDLEQVPHYALVVVRTISSTTDLEGKPVCFWWNASYVSGNLRTQIPIAGIGRVTNDNATHLSTTSESDDPLENRRTHTLRRDSIIGELVIVMNIPF